MHREFIGQAQLPHNALRLSSKIWMAILISDVVDRVTPLEDKGASFCPFSSFLSVPLLLAALTQI